jgi:hypothetical protein
MAYPSLPVSRRRIVLQDDEQNQSDTKLYTYGKLSAASPTVSYPHLDRRYVFISVRYSSRTDCGQQTYTNGITVIDCFREQRTCFRQMHRYIFYINISKNINISIYLIIYLIIYLFTLRILKYQPYRHNHLIYHYKSHARMFRIFSQLF